MANPITPHLSLGTVGELLVQLRLLQFGVQAAPPLKDSGNDLVALRGYAVRTIQVKTRTGRFDLQRLPARFHLVAFVRPHLDDQGAFLLDQTEIYLIPREALTGISLNDDAELRRFTLSAGLIDELFVEP